MPAMFFIAVTLAVHLLQLSFAQYTLKNDYSGARFLDGFSFFTVRLNLLGKIPCRY